MERFFLLRIVATERITVKNAIVKDATIIGIEISGIGVGVGVVSGGVDAVTSDITIFTSL